MSRKKLTIFELFRHEAFPDWRTPRFWLDTRLHMLAPGTLLALTLSFYVKLFMVLLALALLAAAGLVEAGGADRLRAFAFMLDEHAGDLPRAAGQLISLTAFILIGENVARVALDTAVAKPFTRENAGRFLRAGAAAGVLGALHLAGALSAQHFGAPEGVWSRTGFYLCALMALAFVALSAAFREGARLKEEQDLTV
ncbi:DUF2975 domain-containing protein [Amphiplicatus metriothermophilus]|uniref:DUF2975 domain-containing protein n=1 Tax=Amphiplicatus metriothermophilus TaxID=1519374 RepID=A0A239PJU2_9PROT|nr:DUF2975 domain-containing protein [Amphiplicatus metriothermophilus]MBB5517584.1 hypothetical protein [Amphiplicatus metriothermophilus]SNT68082.1 Protein of unknown function [Amphiplicatus metriothermophilus]